MALLIEIIIAVAVFFGIWAILGLIGGILGALFVSIVKILLVVAAVVWICRLIQRLV